MSKLTTMPSLSEATRLMRPKGATFLGAGLLALSCATVAPSPTTPKSFFIKENDCVQRTQEEARKAALSHLLVSDVGHQPGGGFVECVDSFSPQPSGNLGSFEDILEERCAQAALKACSGDKGKLTHGGGGFGPFTSQTEKEGSMDGFVKVLCDGDRVFDDAKDDGDDLGQVVKCNGSIFNYCTGGEGVEHRDSAVVCVDINPG